MERQQSDVEMDNSRPAPVQISSVKWEHGPAHSGPEHQRDCRPNEVSHLQGNVDGAVRDELRALLLSQLHRSSPGNSPKLPMLQQLHYKRPHTPGVRNGQGMCFDKSALVLEALWLDSM
jgi:hypothetical protein